MPLHSMGTLERVLGLAVPIFLVGCDAAPLAPPQLRTAGMASVQASGWESEPAGPRNPKTARPTVPNTASSVVVKETIAGTISFDGVGSVAGFRVTPGGQCFFQGVETNSQLAGDLAGPITFYENERAPCDLSHLTGNGPFVAHVTWNGASGTISGEWTTNCKPDASQPIGLSCDGTMNARGSEGLDGVQFHFKWGPGWYPFAYSGTAFSD